jgi:diguanylate cyclase (GGDEF)-like protein
MRTGSTHWRWWRSVAALVLVTGVAASFLSATMVARSDVERARHRFRTAAGDVLTNVRLALQREADLVNSASAAVVRDPGISNVAFQQWAGDMHLFDHYPELLGVTVLHTVAPEGLDAFAARAAADPIGDTGFQRPTDGRAEYCFLTAVAVRANTLTIPQSYDMCSGPLGEPILRSRDTGEGALSVIKLSETLLGVQTPLYRDNIVPATVEARRAAFQGWVGIALEPDHVLQTALGRRKGLVVELANRGIGFQKAFRTGTAPADAERHSEDFDGGWVGRVYTTPVDGAITAHGAALGLLVGGSLVSVLVAGFVLMLATGRARAERLVEVRTDELRHQALHDPLTGLANRTLVADRAEQLLARSRRAGATHAALYLDLDGFKTVNDTLGHEAGDRLLRAVADRLTGAVRDADTIGRMGGDEFVVLIDGAAVDAAPELVAERILEVMRQPFDLDAGHPPVRVSASVGIATGHRSSGDELVRDADLAMYEAKSKGKDALAVFRPDMEQAVRETRELELDLRSAIDEGQFRLLYQPVYDLDDLSVTSVEALLRWAHPTLGLVLPDVFLPILERTGLIGEVGRWVFDEACRQMAEWHARGSSLSVSVNVSPRQFQSGLVVEQIVGALDATGLAPESLIIEIPEGALMRDLQVSAEQLRALKALGVKIAIDDFGTAYSSLAHLRDLPIDSLKIDRAFIDDGDGTGSQALVRTIVQLGRDLGLRTLAEGVESTEQVDRLRSDDVDQVQGFLLARPLDAATIETTLLLGQRLPSPAP